MLSLCLQIGAGDVGREEVSGLSRPVHLALSFPALELLSVTVGAVVLCLWPAVERAVLPSAAPLLVAVHGDPGAPPFGLVLVEPGVCRGVLVGKLQAVLDVACVKAVGVRVGLVFPRHVVGERLGGVAAADPGEACRAVALGGQGAVLLGVRGTGL